MKVVIVGAGEVGFHIASRLSHENKDVVVIDKDSDAIRRISDNIDVQVIVGSGSSPVSLEDAGIKEAEILLAVTNSDETNLVACLVANIISPYTKKLARVRDADFDKYHATFRDHAPHIDTLINPEIEVVKTIDRLMNMPGAVDVGKFADGRVKFIGINLDKEARLAGSRLHEIPAMLGKPGPLIAAVIRDEELIIPSGDDRLLPGDLVYFISEDDKLLDTLAIFDKHAEPVNRVLIVGGGRIGLRLATLLDDKPIYTKIIEKNPDRCAKLAEKLNKVVVLHGDGSDQRLLNEENIQETDFVITLTDDEEINILASLLAKKLGARKTITKISKFSYFPLMSMIGIEQVVSPRLSAINTILQHIRRGKILSSLSIKGEQAEFMEAVALETSEIVGRPLKNISFPKGSLVASIIRNDNIIIPSGDSVIEPDDRIIIFATRQAIPKIEKILTVKLEYF
ncbi:MAG: Trk system potassium transporter TrkA [Proteobacteria bacterium]|nr:Trk system potassium transporter TrkA [Pseudomonadota bacterium]MBU4067135.1 Trk system potassium transporter TrkA [Pseudomonadota bacterium]MBU4128331.1 Trk system potassium transporter TrkA [Pseudomonadota bacterium]MCG2830520.1 Trk system potassium transporter TrkA [Desulfobacteraceae bacterium]